MSISQRALVSLAVSILLLPQSALAATPIADFEARLGQTLWNLHVVEGLVRSVEVDSETRPTPDALSAYLALLSENVASLTSLAVVKMTTEQKSVVAASLKSTSGRLKDLSLLAGSRGLAGAVSALQHLESSCLATMRLL